MTYLLRYVGMALVGVYILAASSGVPGYLKKDSGGSPAQPAVPAVPGQSKATPAIPGGRTSPSVSPTTTIIPERPFKIGDRVETSTAVRVRTFPRLTGPLVDLVPEDTQGTIKNGPSYANNYYWWEVSYDFGLIGWTFEDGLKLVSASLSPTPAPTLPTQTLTASPSYSPTPVPTPLAGSPESNIVRITSHPSSKLFPVTHGDYIVWMDTRNGNYDLYSFNLKTKVERQLTSSSGNEIFPSIYGNYVVYIDNRQDPANPGHDTSNLYLYDLNSGASSAIYIGSRIQATPYIDAEKIVFTDRRSGVREVYLYNLASKTEKKISTSGREASRPRISGNDIVWTEGTSTGNAIRHHNLVTGTERLITASGSDQMRPSISNRIVVAENRADPYTWNISSYDLNANTQNKISNAWGGNLSISGDDVVWTDMSTYDIYHYNLATGKVTQITEHASQQYHSFVAQRNLVWSDARNSSSGSNDRDIYFLDLDALGL